MVFASPLGGCRDAGKLLMPQHNRECMQQTFQCPVLVKTEPAHFMFDTCMRPDKCLLGSLGRKCLNIISPQIVSYTPESQP